ncbi:MAG: hypothetical protein U5K75_03085 [Ahrensia sp.]|nr:hypothetical protein [Ahrensia sp.]
MSAQPSEILPEPELSEPVVPDANSIVPSVDDVPLSSETTRSDAQKRLDDLFAELRKTRNANAANRLANSIWSEWFKSGSASIDLMLDWSNAAVERKDYNIALDFLDQIVTKMPEFAEGWNRRATLHYTMSNFSKSMVDIQKVLALEPRHFGALSGMATIFERTGNNKAALDAWQRALAVYPAMKSGQEAIVRLSDVLEGDPT